MGSKREREVERLGELGDALAAVSADLTVAARRLPEHERTALLVPVVATDVAMLQVLGEQPAPGAPFDEVRRHLLVVLRAQTPRARVPWHGGPMTVEWALRNRVAVSWRVLDELAEASGMPRPAPQRPIVELALDLVQHSFLRAGLGAPDVAVTVELHVPDEAAWVLTSRQPPGWSPSAELVTGPAGDLCRLACGRATREQTALTATGDLADIWLDVADALAYSDPPP